MSIESFNPKMTSVIIFDKGGALIEREGMVQLVKGINIFKIEDIPASFNPNQIQVELTCEDANVQQIDIKKPVPDFIQEEIRTRQSITKDIIDKSRGLPHRKQRLLELCESMYYSTYEDEFAEVKIYIDSKSEKTGVLKIKYILFDNRIYWEPRVIIDLINDESAMVNVSATIFNNTNFTFDTNIALAEFDLGIGTYPPVSRPRGERGYSAGSPGAGPPRGPPPPPGAGPSGRLRGSRGKVSGLRDEMLKELRSLKMIMK